MKSSTWVYSLKQLKRKAKLGEKPKSDWRTRKHFQLHSSILLSHPGLRRSWLELRILPAIDRPCCRSWTPRPGACRRWPSSQLPKCFCLIKSGEFWSLCFGLDQLIWRRLRLPKYFWRTECLKNNFQHLRRVPTKKVSGCFENNSMQFFYDDLNRLRVYF